MALSLVASMTSIARAARAEMMITGKAFTITSFVVGVGGHDPGDPDIALTPDISLTSLPDQFFGPQAISSATRDGSCIKVKFIIESDQAVGPISNIGLIATYSYSPIAMDPIIGTSFLFAVANFPRFYKLDGEIKNYEFQIQ